MEPIAVEVVRGGVVEAVHLVHAVVVHDDRVVLEAGDPDRLAFLRSSAKPIQALPVVRARPELDDEQIALCCASHLARPEQLAIVERTLAAAGATAAELACGSAPSRLEHTCSGKHAGFLALCTACGWERAGYERAGHPCQETMRRELAEATGVAPEALRTGVDGCGVQTFGVPLRVAARTFVRLRALEGADRVIRAMRTHPELLRGPIAADAIVMRLLDGWVAKGGAEGLLCASSPDGVGIALKVADGAFRAIRPAFAFVLELLGEAHAGIADPVLRDSRGEEVGEIRTRAGAD